MTGREYWSRRVAGAPRLLRREVRRGQIIAHWQAWDAAIRRWRDFVPGLKAQAILEEERKNGTLTRVAACVVNNERLRVVA